MHSNLPSRSSLVHHWQLMTNNAPSTKVFWSNHCTTASISTSLMATKYALCLIECAHTNDTFPKSCPFSHLISWVPLGTTRSDSSFFTAGGYWVAATFWWYLEWPHNVQACTICYISGHNNPSLISINALKHAIQLISMLG